MALSGVGNAQADHRRCGPARMRAVINVCGDLVQQTVGIAACRAVVKARGGVVVNVWTDLEPDLPAAFRSGLSEAILDISRARVRVLMVPLSTYARLGSDGVDWVKATVKGFGSELEVVPDAQHGAAS
jgi:hypothetical protein